MLSGGDIWPLNWAACACNMARAEVGWGTEAGGGLGSVPMLAVWERRCDINSSLELNRLPQKSRPCIQEHMYGEAPTPLNVGALDTLVIGWVCARVRGGRDVVGRPMRWGGSIPGKLILGGLGPGRLAGIP